MFKNHPVSRRLSLYCRMKQNTNLTIYDLHRVLYGAEITTNPRLRESRLHTTRRQVIRAIHLYSLPMTFDRSRKLWQIGAWPK